MRGALLELVTKASKDAQFTGNPQISFFSSAYRRQFIFTSWFAPITFNSDAKPGATITAPIPTLGDLLGRTHLEFTITSALTQQDFADGISLPALGPLSPDWEIAPVGGGATPALANGAGYRAIEYVEWVVDGFTLDRQTPEYFYVRDEIAESEHSRGHLLSAAGFHDGTEAAFGRSLHTTRIRIPLRFSFCETASSFLPLAATGRSKFAIRVKFRPIAQLHRNGTPIAGTSVTITNTARGLASTTVPLQEPTITAAQLVGEQQVIPPPIRRHIQSTPLSYLQQRTQEQRFPVIDGDEPCGNFVKIPTTPDETAQLQIPLETRFSVKEFIWAFRRRVPEQTENRWNVFGTKLAGDGGADTDFRLASVLINGERRVPEASSPFFRQQTTQTHHSRISTQPIYTYPFAINPENPQPTGSINMSKAVTAFFTVDLAEFTSSTPRDFDILLWAPAYAVLEIGGDESAAEKADGVVRVKYVH